MLERLHVDGYKLFSAANFTFGDLTVLVGANGSGKTALRELITLFPALVSGDGTDETLDRAVTQRCREGMAGLFPWNGPKRPLSLRVQVDGDRYDLAVDHVGPPGAARADVVGEELWLGGSMRLALERLASGGKGYRFLARELSSDTRGEEGSRRHDRRHPLALHPYLDLPSDVARFRDGFRGWYDLTPGLDPLGDSLQSNSIDIEGDRLRSDGQNLPQVLLKLKLESEEAFSEIREVFQSVALRDTSLKLQVTTRDRLVHIWLGDQERRYWLADWPSGWKVFLALLVALRTLPRHGLLFVEEPENHLHASLIAAVFDQVRLALVRGAQVLLATHSTEVLNHVEDASQLLLLDGGKATRPGADMAAAIRETGMLLGTAIRTGAVET